MIKFYKNKNIKLKTKIALTISVIAIFTTILNMFFNDENVKVITWSMCVCVFILAELTMPEENAKLRKECLLQAYEIDLLRWSYRGMGKYIEHMNLPECDDIDIRISNELSDIEIKKANYAETLGIKS